jgi:hyperosmotically inducible periplasmic protein
MFANEQMNVNGFGIMASPQPSTKRETMKIKLATSCFIFSALLAPVAAFAATDTTDSDRKHPLTFVKDSVITIKVKSMLADDKAGTLGRVKVDTDDHGVVVLSGYVHTQAEADKAVGIASKVEHVTSVQNNLKIKKDD